MFLMGTPLYWYFDSPPAGHRKGSASRRRPSFANGSRDEAFRHESWGARTANWQNRQWATGRGGVHSRIGTVAPPQKRQDISTFAEELNSSSQSATLTRPLLSPLRKTYTETAIVASNGVHGRKKQQRHNARKKGRCSNMQSASTEGTSRATAASKEEERFELSRKWGTAAEQPMAKGRIFRATRVPQFINFDDRDTAGDTNTQMTSGTDVNAIMGIEPSGGHYSHTALFPPHTWVTQPLDTDPFVITAEKELDDQVTSTEPLSPVLSDGDSSFMTYSSDGISVTIGNGSSGFQTGAISGTICSTETEAELALLEAAECSVVPEQDGDGVMSESSLYTPESSCPEMTFSGSPPLLISLDSVSPTDSIQSLSTLSPVGCEFTSAAAVTGKTSATAAAVTSVKTTITTAMTTASSTTMAAVTSTSSAITSTTSAVTLAATTGITSTVTIPAVTTAFAVTTAVVTTTAVTTTAVNTTSTSAVTMAAVAKATLTTSTIFTVTTAAVTTTSTSTRAAASPTAAVTTTITTPTPGTACNTLSSATFTSMNRSPNPTASTANTIPMPLPSRMCSAASLRSQNLEKDTWLWLPAIIPPLTLLLRWIWFPAPPPNLPWRDPQLADHEKEVKCAHYYLKGCSPDARDVLCIEGKWRNESSCWKWIPGNEDFGGVGYWYDLPTPPEKVPGAWYLVWPAELPMSSSPFLPGQGTWMNGTLMCKHSLLPAVPVGYMPFPLMVM